MRGQNCQWRIAAATVVVCYKNAYLYAVWTDNFGPYGHCDLRKWSSAQWVPPLEDIPEPRRAMGTGWMGGVMIPLMTTLADQLLPDGLWQRLQPLLPPPPSRARGGAPRTVSDRACMAAVIFMARTSTPWALLPVGEFGCGSVTTCWRRFAEWAHAGVFERLQELLLDELGEAGGLDWSRVSVDSFSLRAVRGGPGGRKPGRSGQARVQAAPGG